MIAFNPCPCPANAKRDPPTVAFIPVHPRKLVGWYALCPSCTREIYARSEDALADFWNRSSQDIKATYAPKSR